MIAERCSNAGSILDHLILFHPDIELLNFGNPKILQMLRCLFESCFRSLFPRGRAAADKADYSIILMRTFLQSCRRQASPEAVELVRIQLPISLPSGNFEGRLA